MPDALLPALATPRLRLRAIAIGDAAEAFAAFGDAEAMRYWDMLPAPDVAEVERRFSRMLAVPRAYLGAWRVSLAAGGGFAGCVFYHHREPWNRRMELGWMLVRPLWGQGLMVEAMAAVLAHAFRPEALGGMGANRVEATIEPENARSIGLATKLGFRLEGGPMRSRLAVGDGFRDQLMFGLLAADFSQPDFTRPELA